MLWARRRKLLSPSKLMKKKLLPKRNREERKLKRELRMRMRLSRMVKRKTRKQLEINAI